MKAVQFCFWLQGFYEIHGASAPTPALTPAQSETIQRHLALVFKHEIDPSMADKTGELQATHDGKPSQAVPFKTNDLSQPVYRC